ncbi:MAG: BrnT family toxin [Candidatus Omnitrophica bacterium]|nr:BrnT family toxin [Candidatus Omnitrophota bacterium]MCA9449400.1 BrnT family toxin [Candidatus Omnitrophota bacterium]
MNFEWHARKAAANLKKHGVSFEEAMTVFGDHYSTTFPDPDHSRGEERYLIIGFSKKERVLVISHTHRGETIRLISARSATRRERNFYEDGKEQRIE